MTQMMNQTMKTLTKIRLINWHYFINETITVKGSVLFSGENASGKSTILDAIQMVLTTNSSKFNPAANAKSKRDLRGYVRCKTGEEGNTYVRSEGPVISYVALEFYEETQGRFFVLGVKMDSPDVEADINKKWFCVEGELSSLTFIVNGKPALDKEFTQNGKKIPLESQVGRAKEIFKSRLGRLDNTFPDMIIKAMAFRPMDHVKDFINKFILPKNNIRTDLLQENIRNLREMQKLITEVKSQIDQLRKIVNKADVIEEYDHKILVVDILLKIAVLEDKKNSLQEIVNEKEKNRTLLEVSKKELENSKSELEEAQRRLNELRIALANNEVGRLIEKIEESIRKIKEERERKQLDVQGYETQLQNIKKASVSIDRCSAIVRDLTIKTMSQEEKAASVETLVSVLSERKETAYSENADLSHSKKDYIEKLQDLETRIEALSKNKPVYDVYTTMLLRAINEEFQNRKIQSEARIFADLLEVSDPEWRNAVEGYLNTQRMNIIVEPQYYDIAAQVYDRIRNKVHSVGVVNTTKISEDTETVPNSLFEVVHSDNRYARAYASYLLGRVTRCESVGELKLHKIAITKECMKYQGHVLSKINPAIYATPFLGREAIRIQLNNARQETTILKAQLMTIEESIKTNNSLISLISACNFDTFRSKLFSTEELREIQRRLQSEEAELKEAKKNPTFIELYTKCDAAEKAAQQAQKKRDSLTSELSNRERDLRENEQKEQQLREEIVVAERDKDALVGSNIGAQQEALERYNESIRNKTAGKTAENYAPVRVKYINYKNSALQDLSALQAVYKDGDFGTGMDVMQEYRRDLEKLEKSDLILYEDKLAKAQTDCELEFRENFLVKMRENIARADTQFAELNRALKGTYYGNDSYKFELGPNPNRENLYNMITSDINIGEGTLFSALFNEKYHAEMEELFSQLTDENLNGTSVLEELTDYRSYLDYEIWVISKDGKRQRFSKTYGEKSGGETQTPYYVAIAASFAQMYSGRETTRIVMLDEAFNNMDEERIESMMQFLRSQNFQIILAAPPARMEIIGEYVDSIYLAIRMNNTSTVEEYFL